MNSVLLFTGWGGKVMGSQPSQIADVLSKKDCKVHLFNDRRKTLFLSGSDDFHSAELLEEHIATVVKESDYTMALTSSGGGYAGIKYCLKANVDCVIGISVFTTADQAARDADPRGRKAIPIVDRVLRTEREKNLRHFFEENETKSKVHLFFPRGSSSDAYQSNNLRGLPGVTLHPQAGHRHLMQDSGHSVFDFIREVAEIEKIPFLREAVSA